MSPTNMYINEVTVDDLLNMFYPNPMCEECREKYESIQNITCVAFHRSRICETESSTATLSIEGLSMAPNCFFFPFHRCAEISSPFLIIIMAHEYECSLSETI